MNVQLLVVDDESELRETLRRHYRLQGFDVAVAGNGVEALDLMKRQRVDLVISDIQMPEMDGIALLNAIRNEYPMVHVVMITGYVCMENVLACMRKGADTCVFKPFTDFEELDAAVARAVDALQRWLRILSDLRGLKPEVAETRA
jgi:two-component system response regulator AtoC